MAIGNFQCARNSPVFRFIIGPNMVGPGEQIFNIKILRRLENANLRLVFANTVNTSFNYTFFQLLYMQI